MYDCFMTLIMLLPDVFVGLPYSLDWTSLATQIDFVNKLLELALLLAVIQSRGEKK